MRISYSKMKTYLDCPAKFKYQYVDKVEVERKESPAASRGQRVHKDIENYLRKLTEQVPEEASHLGQFLLGLRNYDKCLPEHHIAVNRDWQPVSPEAEDCYLHGIVDLVVPTEKTLAIYDWKTGREYDEHKNQATVYGILALAHFPQYLGVDIHFVYLDGKRSTPRFVHRDMLKYDQQAIANEISWIEKSLEGTGFPEKPSYGCKFCPFSRFNGGPCVF